MMFAMFILQSKRSLQLDLQKSCQFLQICISKRFLSARQDKLEQKQSFTVSYLVQSCGLSPETAASISKKVLFNSSTKPDSVISCLKNHGFTNIQISSIVEKKPVLLLYDAENILLPKLEFLRSLGVSRTDVSEIVTGNPFILTRSLKNCLIPCHEYLKSIHLHDEKVAAAFKNSFFLLTTKAKPNMASNTSFLKEFGISESSIAAFLTRKPIALCIASDRFSESFHKVLDMGFDPSSGTFLRALEVIVQLSEQTWDRKIELYTSLGLTKDEVISAFRKSPQFMALSEKKISSVMDFLVNKVGLEPSFFSNFPHALNFSLEKRIIPRCSVVAALLSKGALVKDEFSYTSVLNVTEEDFLKKFVFKYVEHVPQLLDILRKKTTPLELGFGVEGCS